eukprot:2514383-Pleurochrysis_carterae.AAC.2
MRAAHDEGRPSALSRSSSCFMNFAYRRMSFSAEASPRAAWCCAMMSLSLSDRLTSISSFWLPSARARLNAARYSRRWAYKALSSSRRASMRSVSTAPSSSST